MIFDRIVDFYWYYIKGLWKYERKLIKYQGFGNRSIKRFKHETGLKWQTVSKILNSIKILDGLELRNHLRSIYNQNKDLFEDPNTYITHFGPIGKSGALIINQFMRCYPGKQRMVIASSEISRLPEGASIIFLDDFIGTGKQGLDYVKNISSSLNSSIKPYLFTVCGTTDGIEYINNYGSRFKINSQLLLDKDQYYLLDPSNSILDEAEKKEIKDLNKLIGIDDRSKYHLGIAFAFYYSAPDNALGILWNDKTPYRKENAERNWYGLIPREY